MDVTSTPSVSRLQTVKERIREKINGTLKAAKLQTSLASKIKSKNLNNSTIVKISLKHNNRALACALTNEKENARRLEREKMVLQKEVKMLHFQNALLRQNMSIVNRMLKDIDVFMNINLPAAIEISNLSESSDLLATEERKSGRFSRESRMSVDDLQGFKLTGMALRVPSSSTEQQNYRNVPSALLNEDERLSAPPSTDSSPAEETFDGQPEIAIHTSRLTDKERHSTFNKNVTRDSSFTMKGNSLLPLDEDMISRGRSAGFVTRRRKRSTASRSSTQTVNSDFNQSKNSLGSGRESICSRQWEMNSLDKFSSESEHAGITGDYALHFDFVMQKDKPQISCSPFSLNPDRNFNAPKESKDTQLDMETTHQPDLLPSRECGLSAIVCRPAEQEKTIYEADMELTSSDAAAIVAVMPKRKIKTSKSGIPIKQDGTSLRKVKTAAQEKAKKGSSKSREKMEIALDAAENIPLELKLNFKPDSTVKHDLPCPINEEKTNIFECDTKAHLANLLTNPSVVCRVEESFGENIPMQFKPSDSSDSRRTYVLPGPVNKGKTKVSGKKTKLCSGRNEGKTSVVFSVEESFAENVDEDVPLEFNVPADKPDSTDRHDSRRTYVLPRAVNKDKTKASESKTKLYPGKKEAKLSVVSRVEESFSENIDEDVPLELIPPADIGGDSTAQYDSRRTYVLPGPVNKAMTKGFDSKSQICPAKNEAKALVSCSAEESFSKNNYLFDECGDGIFAVENLASSHEEQSTDVTGVKQRKTKFGKRQAENIHTPKRHSKKKRKITTNLRDLEAQDGHGSNELANAKTNESIQNFSIKNKEPHMRRETYVLSSTKSNCMLSEFVPRDNGSNCRRETFVIPEPDRLISVSEENAETLEHPAQCLKSAVFNDVHTATEGVIGMEKTDQNVFSHDLDTCVDKSVGFGRIGCKEINQNKSSLNLVSQVDKRKIRTLPTNQNDFHNDKDTLVRESCVNVAQSHFNKPTKYLNAVSATEQDSFILDMVSESILDGTLDCPSFLEFPSINSPETAFMYNISLNDIPPLDHPVFEERDTKETEQLNAFKSLDVKENDNGPANEMTEAESERFCKVENQSMEIIEADIKPFQDLTNKSHDMTKQSTKSCSEVQEEAQVPSRRRRNPVNYKEPKLGTKLRRGDTCTDTEFLSSPCKGTKKKRKGRKKNIKSEECDEKSV